MALDLSALTRATAGQLGGSVSGDISRKLRREGLDDIRGLYNQRGQMLGKLGVPTSGLTPDRQSQLQRQTAGSQTTPSQLKPQPAPEQPGFQAGQAPVSTVSQEAPQRMQEIMQEQRPKMPEAIRGIPDFVQQGMNKLKDVEEFIGRESQLFGEDVKTRVSQAFGNFNPALYQNVTKGARHLGLDIAVPAGTPLQLPVSGRVAVGLDPRGWGSYVKVVGDDGTEFRFSHLSDIAPQITQAARTGARVASGTLFGKTGGVPGTRGSGNTTGAHLDISARVKGKYVDPMKFESVREALR